MLGEFGRVADQVNQDLLEHVLVGDDKRQAFFHVNLVADLRLALDEFFGHAAYLADERFQVEGSGIHLGFSGLDLGGVQNPVDQDQQVYTAFIDFCQTVFLVIVQRVAVGAFQKSLGKSNNRI